MFLCRIHEVIEFGGNCAAVAELVLSLAHKADCVCPLTEGCSVRGTSESGEKEYGECFSRFQYRAPSCTSIRHGYINMNTPVPFCF